MKPSLGAAGLLLLSLGLGGCGHSRREDLLRLCGAMHLFRQGALPAEYGVWTQWATENLQHRDALATFVSLGTAEPAQRAELLDRAARSERIASCALAQRLRAEAATPTPTPSLPPAPVVPLADPLSQVTGVGASPPPPPAANTSAALAARMRSYAPAVRACYERELRTTPRLAGRLEVELSIGADGALLVPPLLHGMESSPALHACVTERLRRANFGPQTDPPVAVRLPFVFSSGE